MTSAEFECAIDELKKHQIVAVITGIETGVEMTDKICAALGMKGNDPATSQNRRNKFKMHESLRINNLRHIPQLLTSKKKKWCSGLAYLPCRTKPLIPLEQMASICETKEQVEQA